MIGSARKLGLGTVQFGLHYGVANTNGQVLHSEVSHILDHARAAGIRMLDTAAAYGESERVIGDLLSPDNAFDIVTKTVPLRCVRVGEPEMSMLRDGFRTSLARLRRSSVRTLLVHHADDLLVPGGECVYEQLCAWRDEGLVGRIGVSAYDAAQIEAVLARYDLTVVQLPLSVLDQRLLRDGTLAALARRGVAVHARSIFLQGLLLMEPSQMPARFSGWRILLERYRMRIAEYGVTPIEAAIGFACRLQAVEAALIGVLSCEQLDACVAAAEAARTLDLSEFACDDPDLIDPRCWANP